MATVGPDLVRLAGAVGPLVAAAAGWRDRSAFAMTEPVVASSDATNIEMRIERDGDEYVLNGRKWWTTNAMHPNCRLLIVMGKADPEGPKHRQQSMVLVPLETPGVTVLRGLPIFGYQDQDGPDEVHKRTIARRELRQHESPVP